MSHHVDRPRPAAPPERPGDQIRRGASGWPAWELFGCHRAAPHNWGDGAGSVLLLRGHPVVALTATEAVIRVGEGKAQTHRRRSRDPLGPAERRLLWKLTP